MFYVGQKVVCIETWTPSEGCGYGDEVGPIKGQIYTVRQIGYLCPPYPDELCVFLNEIDNKKRIYWDDNYLTRGLWEQSFRANRFRPLTERKTSIETFTKLLKPALVDA